MVLFEFVATAAQNPDVVVDAQSHLDGIGSPKRRLSDVGGTTELHGNDFSGVVEARSNDAENGDFRLRVGGEPPRPAHLGPPLTVGVVGAVAVVVPGDEAAVLQTQGAHQRREDAGRIEALQAMVVPALEAEYRLAVGVALSALGGGLVVVEDASIDYLLGCRVTPQQPEPGAIRTFDGADAVLVVVPEAEGQLFSGVLVDVEAFPLSMLESSVMAATIPPFRLPHQTPPQPSRLSELVLYLFSSNTAAQR